MIDQISVINSHQADFLAQMGLASNFNSDERLYLDSKPLVFPEGQVETSTPASGMRHAMINALMLGFGTSSFTATMAVELTNRVAIEAGVSREKQRLVDDPDAHFMNVILRACGALVEGQGFERVKGDTWIIDSRGRINRGNNYIINGTASAEQLARSIAFTRFINRLPVAWFDISELASGNGHMVEDLKDIERQLVINEELRQVGDYTRAEPDTLHTSHARADYIEKLQMGGLLDVRYEPLARIKPDVRTQVELLQSRRRDLESGSLYLCGFETEKVKCILNAYNTIHDKSDGGSLLLQIPEAERDDLGISKADVNDVLSKIRVSRMKLGFSGAELMPVEVVPVPQSWTLLYYTRPNFVTGEISEELKWLMDLNIKFAEGWFPIDSAKFQGKGASYYHNKDLVVEEESRALCIGFRSERQRQLFAQIIGALEFYSQEYSRLLNTSDGRVELVDMFRNGLHLDRQDGEGIGFAQSREALLKDAVKYLLDLMASKVKK